MGCRRARCDNRRIHPKLKLPIASWGERRGRAHAIQPKAAWEVSALQPATASQNVRSTYGYNADAAGELVSYCPPVSVQAGNCLSAFWSYGRDGFGNVSSQTAPGHQGHLGACRPLDPDLGVADREIEGERLLARRQAAGQQLGEGVEPALVERTQGDVWDIYPDRVGRTPRVTESRPSDTDAIRDSGSVQDPGRSAR